MKKVIDINETIKSLTADEIIDALVNKDGSQRTAALGLVTKHFGGSKQSPQLAKEWYRTAVKKIHPDVCKLDSTKAMEELQDIYQYLAKEKKAK